MQFFMQATPVIVDINKESWCISADEIERAITSKTKAIIPVHLYGQPAEMCKIKAIAKAYDLVIIEDRRALERCIITK